MSTNTPYRTIVSWFRERGMKVISPSWCSDGWCAGDEPGMLIVSTEQKSQLSPVVADTVAYYENSEGSDEFQRFLFVHGLWFEWNNAATICIYEDTAPCEDVDVAALQDGLVN